MKLYTIIPHVADVRLRIEADTMQELFAAALEGMAQISKRDFCATPRTFSLEHAVSITAPDTTALLIDFLSEALTYSHVERAIFCKAKFAKLNPTALKAIIAGSKTNSFDKDIKAVTYHEAEVKENNKGHYETMIVFDI